MDRRLRSQIEVAGPKAYRDPYALRPDRRHDSYRDWAGFFLRCAYLVEVFCRDLQATVPTPLFCRLVTRPATTCKWFISASFPIPYSIPHYTQRDKRTQAIPISPSDPNVSSTRLSSVSRRTLFQSVPHVAVNGLLIEPPRVCLGVDRLHSEGLRLKYARGDKQ